MELTFATCTFLLKSQENWADVLTKALPHPAHTLCTQRQ